MTILDEIAAMTVRNRTGALADNILTGNALLRRVAENARREFEALPWHAKLRRRMRARIRNAFWRVRVAADVLRHGQNSSWLDD